MGWWRDRNVHLWCDITMTPKQKQQDAERKWMKEDDFYFYNCVSQFLLFCALWYSLQQSEVVSSQVSVWLEKSKFLA